MKANTSLFLWVGLALLSNARAIELSGKVQSAQDQTALIEVEGPAIPKISDKAEIFFKLPDLDEEIAVAVGEVAAVNADGIQLKIEKATGEVARDQLVRIHSAQPQARPTATTPPVIAATATAVSTPAEPTPATPLPTAKKSAKLLTFNNQPIGSLASDAFATYGFRFSQGKGVPKIFAAQPNMLLPASARKVLLVDGGPVTSLTIKLDPPAKRFTLYRIGTTKGASTPTWKMTAFNGNGQALDSTGEIHGLPQSAISLSVKADSIARIDLTSDNRFGSGTWATWNSLPIAGFGVER